MSTKGHLTRDQAAAIVGERAIQQLAGQGCEPTSRLQCDGDTRVEFASSVRCTDSDGTPCTVTAYCYQEPEDIDAADDLSLLDWAVAGYEVS